MRIEPTHQPQATPLAPELRLLPVETSDSRIPWEEPPVPRAYPLTSGSIRDYLPIPPMRLHPILTDRKAWLLIAAAVILTFGVVRGVYQSKQTHAQLAELKQEIARAPIQP